MGALNLENFAILSLPGLPKLSVPLIENENPRLVYAQLAARFHPGQPKTLIAMTGTNGKSSTVEFLRQIWDSAGHKAACFGTLGVRTAKGHTPLSHTTPDAVDFKIILIITAMSANILPPKRVCLQSLPRPAPMSS